MSTRGTAPGRGGAARWLLAGLAFGLVGAGGFLAGRRYPFEWLRTLWPPPEATLPFGWTRAPVGPGPRYEATVAVVGDAVHVFGGFSDSVRNATVTTYRFSFRERRWRRLRDMPTAVTHRAPAIVGDTVWVAGGFEGRSPGPAVREVWGYDTQQDTWFAGPALPNRVGGGGFAAIDGRLHYFGGYTADRQTPSVDHWSIAVEDAVQGRPAWRTHRPVPRPRGHLASVVLGGSVYLIGGAERHDPVQIDRQYVDRYDPATDSWAEIAELPTPRSHTEPSTFVYDGRIFVIGGRNLPGLQRQTSSVVVYDPAIDLWIARPPLPAGRLAPIAFMRDDTLTAGLGAVRDLPTVDTSLWQRYEGPGWTTGPSQPVRLGEVAGGIIGPHLILTGQGSDHTLVFDLGRGRWMPPDFAARRPAVGHHSAAEVLDGELWLLGGLGQLGSIVQVYNAARNEWRFGPDIPMSVGSAASALIGGQIYLAGGIANGKTTDALWRLDPAGARWVRLAPMPFPRNHAASATDGKRMFVFGGRGPGSGDGNVLANGYDEVQIYDPATDEWIASGSGPGAPTRLPQARGGMGKALYVGGEFYVIGGETLDGPGATSRRTYGRVDIYNPGSDTWRLGVPLPTARHGIFPVAVGDWIYVAGGGASAGYSLSNILEILWRPPPP